MMCTTQRIKEPECAITPLRGHQTANRLLAMEHEASIREEATRLNSHLKGQESGFSIQGASPE